MDQQLEFMWSVADDACAFVVEDLLTEVEKKIGNAAVPHRSEAEIDRVLGAFRHVIPATNCQSVASILNAGWQVFHDVSFWKEMPDVHERRVVVLADLVLKSIEVLHVEQLTAKKPC